MNAKLMWIGQAGFILKTGQGFCRSVLRGSKGKRRENLSAVSGKRQRTCRPGSDDACALGPF